MQLSGSSREMGSELTFLRGTIRAFPPSFLRHSSYQACHLWHYLPSPGAVTALLTTMSDPLWRTCYELPAPEPLLEEVTGSDYPISKCHPRPSLTFYFRLY